MRIFLSWSNWSQAHGFQGIGTRLGLNLPFTGISVRAPSFVRINDVVLGSNFGLSIFIVLAFIVDFSCRTFA